LKVERESQFNRAGGGSEFHIRCDSAEQSSGEWCLLKWHTPNDTAAAALGLTFFW